MRLESLRLQNFRGFEDATLPLDRPLTVLFGENGSGKSSVLRALALSFTGIIKEPLERARSGLRHVSSDKDVRTGTEQANMTMLWKHDEQILESKHRVTRNGSGSFGKHLGQIRNEIASGKKIFLPIFYSANRVIDDSQSVLQPIDAPTTLISDTHGVLDDTLDPGRTGFRSFFLWFKEREDAENRRKVQEKDLSVSDPQLTALRIAIEGLLPGYTNPRIQHDPLRLEITKGNQALSMDQLSDGEKQVLVMTADIARRLSMVYAKEPNPLEQEAVILVDEVELHLHPLWQRQILPAWRRVFPGCQFIVTTHSPQVISEVPNDAVFVIKNFQFFRPGAPTEGRDSNSILEEAMGTPERPHDVKEELEKIAALIENEHYVETHERLDVLAQRLTESDNEVVRLRVLLHFMEGSHAAGSQK